jgi:single-strand DNA-binding protein
MPNLNRTQLMGHLCRDPEARYLSNGTCVTDCSIASSEKWKDKNTGEMKDKVVFVDFTVWGRRGELFAEWFKKGSAVFVEGKLELDQWEDKDTGAKRSKLKLNVQNFENVGGRGDAPARQPAGDPQEMAANADGEYRSPEFDETVPF